MADYSSLGSWDPNAFNMPLTMSAPSMVSPTDSIEGTVNIPNFSSGSGTNFLGLNGQQTLSAALGGLQTLGSLWAAWQSAKLAKKQFNFTRDITNTNLANQIKSYNTALTDRITSRGVMEGLSPEQVQSYIDQNSLTRKPTGH